MARMPKRDSKFNSEARKDSLPLLLVVGFIMFLAAMQMFNIDTNQIQEKQRSNIDDCLTPENIDFQLPIFPRAKTSTRSQPEYHELINYDDVLVIRNLNSAMSMQIADYFQAKRNISNLNICNITTSTAETVSRTTFENEIRTPIEDYIVNNGLLGVINYIVTTKDVPLRVAEEDTSDDDWNQPWTIDRASVDAELALILGLYQNNIGEPWWINNPYFNPDPYDDFSFQEYRYFLVTRLTGYDFEDIKAMIDNAEISIGRKGVFVLDVDPGKDGGSYQAGNDWMRSANTTLSANNFDVLLDETNTFLTNQFNTSGYTSWGSNDGHYPTNTLLNPGFENDANGDDVPDNWFFVNDTSVGSCSRNDTVVRNGAWSVKISRDATSENASYIAQNFTVKVDTRYYAVGYVNLSGVSSDRGAHLLVKAYDSQGNVVKYYNGSARTGTTNNWVSLSQVHYEPLEGITNISVGVALSKSSGTAFFDDIRLYEIKPHNLWIPGALAETYVSTGGRSFNYPTSYGQSLVADLIRDGVTGVKGYVYEPYLSACAHPDILFDAYTQGFYSAESYYMASGYLGWMDCVVGDPKVSPYDLDIVPDLSIIPQDVSFSNNKPREGETIDIFAQIENLGLAPASKVEVNFYAGEPLAGVFLGGSTLDIQGSGSNMTSISWDTTGYIGDHNITVVVDPKDAFYELNESNNIANTSITVNTGYPVADPGSDSFVDEDSPHTFDGSASTDNTSIANYTWDFGDGNVGYGVSPTHIYTSQGSYVVVLNVTNVYGLWDLDTVNISVINVEPIADAGEDKFGNEGVGIEFSASGSTDTPSDIDSLNYTWYFGDGNIDYGMITSYAYEDDGTYTVTLEVRDDDLAIDADTINVTLGNVAPYIIPVPHQIAQEDSPFTININATDVSGDTITFFDNSTMFDIDPTTGVISFTPRNENVGVHLINITARDEDDGESFTEFQMTVENTNDPPHIVSTPITAAVEENLYQYDLVVEDDDFLVAPDEVITYSLDSSPSGVEIDSSGKITWIPTDFQASQMFNVIVNVSDGEAYDIQIFDVTVTNINDEPVITSTPITSAVEDEYYAYDVDAGDVDIEDVLTYTFDLAPEGMSIDGASGVISWLPTNDFVGNNVVVVRVTDVAGTNDTQEFIILVDNTNDAPVLESIGGLIAAEDENFYYKVEATDVDLNDELSFYDDSELFDIEENTGIISFTPSNGDVGTHTLRITVRDNAGAIDTETIILTVLNMNDPPILDFVSDWLLKEDTPFTLVVTASDPDVGDSITFYDNTTLFDIDSETGEISFTPTNEDVGVHIINITVLDESGGMDYQTVKFIIENVNDPPTIEQKDDPNLSVGLSLSTGETFTFKVNVSDEDANDTLTFSDDSDMFDIDPNTGEISFTPKKEHIGTHTVNITVTDCEGNTDYMIVTFEVVAEEEDKGLGLIWLVLLLVIAVIIIFIVFMGWKRRKAKPGEETVVFEVSEEDVVVIEKPKPGNLPPPPPPPPPPPS